MWLGRFLSPTALTRRSARVSVRINQQRDLLINNWKLRNLKDRHRGQRCFIIGNGPSLTVQDLDKLERENTFAANKIYLAFDQTRWRPRYYVVEDDHMIQQHHQQILRLKGSVKFINDNWKGLFRGDREVIWYPWRFLEDEQFPKFSSNPLEALYCGYMVTYISLQLAFFMGFTRVYLVGVDFNYSLVAPGQDSIQHSADHPQDHFTPDYFKPGEVRYLPQLERAERAMRCAKDFYEAHGRKIRNATRGGKLEVFERISLEEALVD
jgi:hypothetical protein